MKKVVVSMCLFSNLCKFVPAKGGNSRASKRAVKSAGNSKKRKATVEEMANGENGQLEEVRRESLKRVAIFVIISQTPGRL